MTNTRHYCLRWNNHITNFVQVITQLLKSETFVDCTIAIEDGKTIKCHKMVLAACSSYFNELFMKNPCDHPMVILSDVKYHEIRAILDYMYRGEVNVPAEELQSLLKIAMFLKVKGLFDDDPGDRGQVPEPEPEEPALAMLTTAAVAAQSAAVAAAAAAAAAAVNDNGLPLNNGYNSPPPHVAAPFSMPFGTSPLDGHNPMALWPLAGIPHMPQHPISGHQPPPRSSFLAGSYDAICDTSPLGRKKRSSHMANRDTPILRNVLGGQNDSQMNDSSETYNNNSNGSVHDPEGRRNSSEHSEPMAEDEEKPITPKKFGPHKDAKPEWKRYKQYTREDIAAAMMAVKNKEMSALQAANKFGIPSRTLYDKLKKAGILPTRGAGIQRGARSEASAALDAALCADSARFPYPSGINGNVYGAAGGSGVSESEGEANGYEVPTSLVGPSNGHTSRHEDMDMQAASHSGYQSDNEEGAEDLSIGSRRSSDHSVIVPPVVKEEGDEGSMQHDES